MWWVARGNEQVEGRCRSGWPRWGWWWVYAVVGVVVGVNIVVADFVTAGGGKRGVGCEQGSSIRSERGKEGVDGEMGATTSTAEVPHPRPDRGDVGRLPIITGTLFRAGGGKMVGGEKEQEEGAARLCWGNVMVSSATQSDPAEVISYVGATVCFPAQSVGTTNIEAASSTFAPGRM